MAVQLLEVNTSRKLVLNSAESSGEWEYVSRAVGEADPEGAATSAAIAASPFWWKTMARQSADTTPLGGGLYRTVIRYGFDKAAAAGQNAAMPDPTVGTPIPGSGPGGGSPSDPPTGPAAGGSPGSGGDTKIEGNVSLEIGGRPPRLYVSKETVISGGLGGATPRDWRHSINVDPKGKVEGTDLPEPKVVLNLEFVADYVSWNFINRLAETVWTTNKEPWYTFPAQTACLMGASLKTQQDGRVGVGLKIGLIPAYVVKKNTLRRDDDGDVLGPGLPNGDITVPGWHFLWCGFKTESDPVTKTSVERPSEFYVERLLDTSDYTLLGIGR